MELSFIRLFRLLKRDLVSKSKMLLLLIFSLAIIVALMMFVSTEEYCNPGNYIKIVDVIFFFALYMSGAILSASIFTEFRNPSSRSLYLSLPATHLEKWLSKWIICVPIHLSIAFLIIAITYMIMGNLLHNVWPECRFLPLNEINKNSFLQSFKVYFIFQSLCFLLGIIFGKNALIKTLATIAALILVFSGIMTGVIGIIFGDNPDSNLNIGLTILPNIAFIITPLLWLSSFFKLKEKQL